jgi:hypothetical protein
MKTLVMVNGAVPKHENTWLEAYFLTAMDEDEWSVSSLGRFNVLKPIGNYLYSRYLTWETSYFYRILYLCI